MSYDPGLQYNYSNPYAIPPTRFYAYQHSFPPYVTQQPNHLSQYSRAETSGEEFSSSYNQPLPSLRADSDPPSPLTLLDNSTASVLRPVESPVKRRPGRPPGSKNSTAAAKAAAKAPKTKAATKSKARKDALGKENKSAGGKSSTDDIVEISDSDSELDESDGRKNWADGEKTKFFTFLLGPGDAGDYRFEQHKKNPAHVYNRASELLFGGARTAKAVGALWTRSIQIYTWMVAFEKFTGNGGGDPDSDDPTAILNKLTAARRAGLPIGHLKPSLITTWESNGWGKLFGDRLGTSAKVSREVIRNPATPLSDVEDNIDASDSDHDADTDIQPPAKQPKTPAPAKKTAAATVSESKHTPATKFRVQANASLGNMAEFMKVRMLGEEKKTKMMEGRLELDKAEFDLEKQKVDTDTQRAKVEMARTVLTMEGATTEVKDAANSYLLALFQ